MSLSSPRHAAALTVLDHWTAPDEAQEALRVRYVEHLRAHPDGLDRDCRPDHLTASTAVLSPDGAQVLLTLHAKAQQWFQLGGHVDVDDASLPDAASREVAEESGLGSFRLDPVPVHLDAHDVTFCAGGDATHLDVRFLAVADPDGATAVSDESVDVRWWPVDDLPSDEASLEELVRLARARLLG